MLSLTIALACTPDPEPVTDEPTGEVGTPTPEVQSPEATTPTGSPPEGSTQPAEDARGVPVLAHRPENADEAGAVVMVTGSIDNSTIAQVRLMAVRDGQAEIFDLRAGLEGRFFAEAPAHWDEGVYISAVEVDPADPANVATGWGAAPEPIRLEGEDIHVVFAIGDHPAWTEGVTPALDQIVDAGPLNEQRDAP